MYVMRPSKLRHPLAVLRRICGEDESRPLGQKEMAALVGRATITIQNIENGKLRLSEELAQDIHHETGVSLGWLLNGNPRVRPTTPDGEPYTHDDFVSTQSNKIHVHFRNSPSVSFGAVSLYAPLRAILSEANKRSKFKLAIYKITKAFEKLAKQYGLDSSLYPHDTIEELDPPRGMALMRADCSLLDTAVDLLVNPDRPKGSKIPAPKFRPLFLSEMEKQKKRWGDFAT
jgi:transcriptional regulator with XRE-family HTH domain